LFTCLGIGRTDEVAIGDSRENCRNLSWHELCCISEGRVMPHTADPVQSADGPSSDIFLKAKQ